MRLTLDSKDKLLLKPRTPLELFQACHLTCAVDLEPSLKTAFSRRFVRFGNASQVEVIVVVLVVVVVVVVVIVVLVLGPGPESFPRGVNVGLHVSLFRLTNSRRNTVSSSFPNFFSCKEKEFLMCTQYLVYMYIQQKYLYYVPVQ